MSVQNQSPSIAEGFVIELVGMMYLISGPPRCGKTTLAANLSKTINTSWISSDTLESIVMECVSPEELRTRFPKREMRLQTKHGNDSMYTTFTAKQIAHAYATQAKATQRAIEMFALVEEQEGRDVIVEGYHVSPALIKKLAKKFGSQHVRSLVLTRYDIDSIVEGCLSHTAKNDWFIKKTKDPETYPRIAAMIAQYSRDFSKQAKKYGIKEINVDKDFKGSLKRAMEYLQSKSEYV